MRLYSTKTFKGLGTLIYHKDTLQALSFARARPVAARHLHEHFPVDSAGGGGKGGARASAETSTNRSDDGDDGEDNVVGDDCGDAEDEDEDDDDEMSGEEKARRSRWLVSGGKDGRVVVWALMDFTARGHDDSRRDH